MANFYRQCEYKKKHSPDLGKHVYQHVYGEGVFDVLSGLKGKLFGKTAKKMANKVAKKATSTALDKTGNYVGNKAGDKIVKLLQGNNKNQPLIPSGFNNNTPLTAAEKNARMQRILEGSGIRRRG